MTENNQQWFEKLNSELVYDQSKTFAIDKKDVDSTLKSLNNIITEEQVKVVFGRKYRQCIARLLPICAFLLCHKDKIFMQLPVTKNYSQYVKHLNLSNTNLFNSYKLTFYNKQSNNNIYNLLTRYVTHSYEESNTSDIKMFNMRALKDLQKLNVIKLYVEQKHFSNNNSEKTYSYSYVISHSNVLNLLSIFNISFSYNISNHSLSTNTLFIPRYVTHSYEEQDKIINNIETKYIKKGKEVKHSKEYIQYIYPLINELDRQTTTGIYRYSLKENGCRPYAYICSSNKHSENNEISEREALLNDELGENNWIEWDRSASIYNITYSYNKKDYLSNSINMHSKMANKQLEKDTQEYEDFKLLNMTKYFGDGRTVRSLLNAQMKYAEKIKEMNEQEINEYIEELNDKENKGKRKSQKARILAKYDNNLKRTNLLMNNISHDMTFDEAVIKAVENYKAEKKNMNNFIGKFLPEDAIFIMEATVNLATMNDLREMGYKTVSIYDGFYTTCKDKDLIESVYKKNVEKFIINKDF